MPEQQLYTMGERLPVEISRIAHPDDIHIFGGHFGDRTYYADYAGIAAKFAPKSILEIGVRFGYSGIALSFGALQSFKPVGRQKLIYRGMDGEFFGCEFEGADGYKLYRSNAVAARNFELFYPDAKLDAKFFGVNTQVTPFPDEVTKRTYDLINVDGDHSYAGAMKDCVACWPLLNPGGMMLVDDMSFAEVGPAVRAFVAEREAAGEIVRWQYYQNERDMMLIRKGE